MAERYDAVVVGGGHNGLTAAAYLSRAGMRVLILERRHVLGGAAVTEEVFPGFRFSECSYVVSLLLPEIIRELGLPRHGLEILPFESTFTPVDEGRYLRMTNDEGRLSTSSASGRGGTPRRTSSSASSWPRSCGSSGRSCRSSRLTRPATIPGSGFPWPPS